jgi:hypothetical protein
MTQPWSSGARLREQGLEPDYWHLSGHAVSLYGRPAGVASAGLDQGGLLPPYFALGRCCITASWHVAGQPQPHHGDYRGPVNLARQ